MKPSRDKPNAETGVTDEIIAEEVRAHGLARRIGPVRRLYQWVLSWAETRHAAKAMALLAYTEAIFFPVPADLLLGALCLGKPRRSFHWAFICTLWSVLGGTTAMLLGLAIGEARVVEAMNWLGQGEKASLALRYFRDWGFWAVAVAALTPVPYMVFSWVAGFAEIQWWQFVLASVIFRPMRFFTVAGLVYLVGPPAKRLIDRYFNLATILFMVVVLVVVVAVRYLRN
ncbi:MAG TPA: VTT domain-containing protein [Phycisphaerae bacterium]|nr:VTT domain-containing protein [Phycisphaerae bacterium]